MSLFNWLRPASSTNKSLQTRPLQMRSLQLETLDRRDQMSTVALPPPEMMPMDIKFVGPKPLIAAVSAPTTLAASRGLASHRFGDFAWGQETAWRGVMISPNGLTEANIQELKSFNVNLVRWQLYAGQESVGTSEQYWKWFNDRLRDIDRQLPLMRAAGIRVVIDLHAPPGGVIGSGENSEHVLFKQRWAQTDFLRTWEILASRYRNQDGIVGYDLVNEPRYKSVGNGLKNLNQLVEDAIKVIRRYDSNKAIIIEPRYGDPFRLGELANFRDHKLVYSVHVYAPAYYTGQGLEGKPTGVAYTAQVRAKLYEMLDRIDTFQKNRGGVPIYIGEFGVSRFATDGEKYLRDATRYFESKGWEWTVHAYREGTSPDPRLNPWDFTFEPKRKAELLSLFARNGR